MSKLVIFAIAVVPLLTLAGLLIALFWPQVRAAFRRPERTPWRRLALVLAAFLLVLAPDFAFAQAAVAAAAPDTAISVSSYVYSGLATILTFAATWGLNKLVGIQLNAEAQANLHLAAETGARAVATKLGVGMKVDDAVAQVQAHVEASVPAAIRKLAPPADVLRNLILSKLSTVSAAPTTGL